MEFQVSFSQDILGKFCTKCLFLIACKSDGSSTRTNSVSQIDLHTAADSVTSAMTSLVRKLNAGKRDFKYFH